MTADEDDRIAYLAGEGGGLLPPGDRADLDELRATLSDPALWAEPPDRLEDSIVQAIADEARDSSRSASRRRRIRSRWLTRPRVGLGLASLAAAALVAAVIVISAGNNGPAPQRFAMVVTGTSLAPGAQGSARLTKEPSGWRIDLSAKGLPHLANSRYYEAWLRNAAGVLVPVGTFNDARQVTLWSGVPVTQFRTLTVTQQRAGQPLSSGRRVLIGTIRSGR